MARWLILFPGEKGQVGVLYFGPDKNKARQLVEKHLRSAANEEVTIHRTTNSVKITDEDLDLVVPRDAF